MSSVVALIPARAGSKRIPHKNVRKLGEHPLLAYSIHTALKSNIFDAVICVTDDGRYADIARYYGAEVPGLRPVEISSDKSPDIQWVTWIMSMLESQGRVFDAFSILRPTSPFRKPGTIQRAWQKFTTETGCDSLRAVEKCRQHPGKMWVINDSRMVPLLPFSHEGQPWHSNQYAALPEVYVQNASLEIAWTKILATSGTISGHVVIPFFTNEEEGFDINNEDDWEKADYLVRNNAESIPEFNVAPMDTEK